MSILLAPWARSEEWSKTYSVSGQPDLRVDTSDANLHVDAWEQTTIAVPCSADQHPREDPNLLAKS